MGGVFERFYIAGYVIAVSKNAGPDAGVLKAPLAIQSVYSKIVVQRKVFPEYIFALGIDPSVNPVGAGDIAGYNDLLANGLPMVVDSFSSDEYQERVDQLR